MTTLRQAGQIGIVVLAFWATLSIDADNGQRFLVDAARGGALSREILGAMAIILATLSLGRFLMSDGSSAIGAWCESHRDWLVGLSLGGVALGLFCLM